MIRFSAIFRKKWNATWKDFTAGVKREVLDPLDPTAGPSPRTPLSYLTQAAAFTGAMAGAGAEMLMFAALFGDPILFAPSVLPVAGVTSLAGTVLGGGLLLYLSREERASPLRLLPILPVIAGVALTTAIATALPLGLRFAAGAVKAAWQAAKESRQPDPPSDNPKDYLSPEQLWPGPGYLLNKKAGASFNKSLISSPSGRGEEGITTSPSGSDRCRGGVRR